MMKKIIFLVVLFGVLGLVVFSQGSSSASLAVLGRFLSSASLSTQFEQNNGEVEFENFDLDFDEDEIERRFPGLSDWQRPDGPPRVGLQVGHWKTEELPDEFERLRKRGGGTRGGGKKEWEVNLSIAEEAATLLRDQGIVVDILPATIPEAYWADAFIAIHADGNDNPNVSGFKVASAYACFPMFHSEWPRSQEHTRDTSILHQRVSGLRNDCPQGAEASRLLELLQMEYQKATDLSLDRNVTHNMRGYYAFNWRRYEHSVHPMTTAVILETGFLTSPHDRAILISDPHKAAEGITNAATRFLKEQNLL